MAKPKFNCRHNPLEYSPLEAKFINLINSDKELKKMAEGLNLLHEWRIQTKTFKNGRIVVKTYWLDFYSPNKQVDIEIHHNGHKKGRWFIPSQGLDVYTKDKERKRLLEKLGIKTIEIYESRLTKGWIRYYLRKIQSFPDKPTLVNFLQNP